jgi:hypothetical protein
MRELLRGAAERAIDYLAKIDDRPVCPDPTVGLSALGGPLPEAPNRPPARDQHAGRAGHTGDDGDGRPPVLRSGHRWSSGRRHTPSLFKALRVIGLGRRRVISVPAGDLGRMRVDALPRA